MRLAHVPIDHVVDDWREQACGAGEHRGLRVARDHEPVVLDRR